MLHNKISIKESPIKNYFHVYENGVDTGYIEFCGSNTYTVQLENCYPKYFKGHGSLKKAKEFCLNQNHPFKRIKSK